MKSQFVIIEKIIIFLTIFQLFGCRGNLSPDAPTELHLDQQYDLNMTRLHKLSQVTGVRLFWWNVAWGSFNQNSDLDHNLIELTNSNARPDLMILGEYKDMILSQHTHNELKRHYPHQYFMSYSPTDIVGVKVFSTRALTYHGIRNIPWYPINETDSSKQQAYYNHWKTAAASEARFWDRSVGLFSFSHGGQTYTLAPVHLLEPWAALVSSEGRTDLIKSFFNDKLNPLANQIGHLRRIIKNHAGGMQNVLMIGDFNIPSSLYGMTPDIYKNLSQSMTEGFFGNPDTFPAESARHKVHGFLKKLSIKIDHALMGSSLDRIGGAAIHMRGSDHYPIYVVVAPKKSGFWGWW
jgi:hypothetical protein